MIVTSENCYDNNVFICTQNGEFRLNNPVFVIEDIAHALSLNCRFNGHVNHFYSVAQHSIMVSKLMDFLNLGDPLEGLLHDGTEAYMSDVPAPFKTMLPDWTAIDKQLESALRAQFNLPPTKTEGCKKADWLALFIEAACLQPGAGHAFEDPHGFRNEAVHLIGTFPQLWVPKRQETDVVYYDFLCYYDMLAERYE